MTNTIGATPEERELIERHSTMLRREAIGLCGAACAQTEQWKIAAALESLISDIAKLREALDWLGQNVGMELTWGEIDDDPSECAWRVHRCHGGYNDREWDLIATGATPLEALSAALNTTKGQSNGE